MPLNCNILKEKEREKNEPEKSKKELITPEAERQAAFDPFSL